MSAFPYRWMRASRKKIVLPLLAVAFGFLPAGPAPAQTPPDGEKIEPVPLAPGPVLRRAPESSSWTITCAYPEPKDGGAAEGAPPPLRLTSIHIVKSGRAYEEVRTYSNGSRRETWHVEDLQFEAAPAGSPQKVNVYSADSFGGGEIDPLLFSNYAVSDFPDLDWLSAGDYLGVAKGRNGAGALLVFRRQGAGLMPGVFPGQGTPLADTTVYLDPQTRLPVQIRTDDVTFTFEFGSGPSGPLELPPEVKSLLAERERVRKALTTRVPSY